MFIQTIQGFFKMLGRTKKEKQSAYKGMAIATALLVFFPALYLGIKDKMPGAQ